MNKHLLAIGGAVGVGIAVFMGVWGASQTPQGAMGGTPQPVSTMPAQGIGVTVTLPRGERMTGAELVALVQQHRENDPSFSKWVFENVDQGWVEGDVVISSADGEFAFVRWNNDLSAARPDAIMLACDTGVVHTGSVVHLQASILNAICVNRACTIGLRYVTGVSVGGGAAK